jgi:acetylornithine deacetylase/succinyl-diaminopimelate desuccinylase-like protein
VNDGREKVTRPIWAAADGEVGQGAPTVGPDGPHSNDPRWQSVWSATREELAQFVAIPSVSGSARHDSELRRCAAAVCAALSEAGAQAEVVSSGGGPAVLASVQGPPGTPTVLLYAHHDVVSASSPEAWRSPPFEAQERDGRLYGRGAADDKSGVAIHLATVRWFGEDPPVNLAVLIEGEEEIGSPNLRGFLADHADALRADVVVVADGASVAVGEPILTLACRGTLEVDVEVRVLERGIHSGQYGGAVPDAVTVLTRLLASLHDKRGRVAVAGLEVDEAMDAELDDAALARDAGLLDGVHLLGGSALSEAVWCAPAITPIALEVPSFTDPVNALQPTARARLSIRTAPGQDPTAAFAAIETHLQGSVDWGARIDVSLVAGSCRGWRRPSAGKATATMAAAYRSVWGRPPTEQGLGATLPLLAELSESMAAAELVMTGIQDPGANFHGVDESIDLAELERACRAQIEFLNTVARPDRDRAK